VIVSSKGQTGQQSDPRPPTDAVAEILEDGVLVGWQLNDGREVTL
jgi:hypothetical protein